MLFQFSRFSKGSCTFGLVALNDLVVAVIGSSPTEQRRRRSGVAISRESPSVGRRHQRIVDLQALFLPVLFVRHVLHTADLLQQIDRAIAELVVAVGTAGVLVHHVGDEIRTCE